MTDGSTQGRAVEGARQWGVRLHARLRATRQRARLGRDGATLEGADGASWGGDSMPGVFSVVAHQGDDLAFQGVSLLAALRQGDRVRSVYLTAGDDDDAPWYWQAREAGLRAAYSVMAGVDDVWETARRNIGGQSVTQLTLVGARHVSLVFFRLPDGRVDGAGGRRYGGGSLQKLWEGNVLQLTSVDDESVHTMATLQESLLALLDEFRPTRVATLDFDGPFDDGDHSDHHAVALLTARVVETYRATIPDPTALAFEGFLGYRIAELPSNLTAEQEVDKQNAFFAYARSDHKTSHTLEASATRPEGEWLSREYRVGELS